MAGEHPHVSHTAVAQVEAAASLLQLPNKTLHQWIHDLEHQMIKCGAAHFMLRSKEALVEYAVHSMKAEADGSTHVFRDAITGAAGAMSLDLYAESALRQIITAISPHAGYLGHLGPQFALTAGLTAWRIASPYMEKEADSMRQRAVEYLGSDQSNYYNAILGEQLYEDSVSLKTLAYIPRLPELAFQGITRGMGYAGSACTDGLSSLKNAAQRLLSRTGDALRNMAPNAKESNVNPLDFRRALTLSMAEHLIEVNNSYHLTEIQQALYVGYLEYHIDKQLQQDNGMMQIIQCSGEFNLDETFVENLDYLERNLAENVSASVSRQCVMHPAVAQKYDDLLASCHGNKEKKTMVERVFRKHMLENQLALTRIQKELQDQKIQTSHILSHVKDLHEDMLIQREKEKILEQQAATLAQFQGVINGFGALANIGSACDNKGLQTFGIVGVSVTQATLAMAQLTGSFGLQAVSGLAMLTPASALIGSILTLSQLFSRGKNSEGKALQALLECVDALHRDMMKGFGIIIENQKITIDLIVAGFKAMDEKLYHVITQIIESNVK